MGHGSYVVRVVVDARTRHDVPRPTVDVVAQIYFVLSFVPVKYNLRSTDTSSLWNLAVICRD